MRPPTNSVGALNTARRDANYKRAEWLMFVKEGLFTANDLFEEAVKEESAALLKLSLRQVLLAQPGWGRHRTAAVLDHIVSVSAAKIDSRRMTVGWLLDSRAGGRRFAAWLDAFEEKTSPWPGFPYTRRSVV